MTVYEPVGVVQRSRRGIRRLRPLTMEAQKLAPALAAGNAIVLKPSEVTPTVGLSWVGSASKPAFHQVSSTSWQARTLKPACPLSATPECTWWPSPAYSAGRAIALAAAERLVPVVLELGGKSPHTVFADANIEQAIGSIIDGI
jgi:betaine-aldehyde dehydrogenase